MSNENYMKINNVAAPLSDLNVTNATVTNLTVQNLNVGELLINGEDWLALPINVPGELGVSGAPTKIVFMADRPYLVNATAQRVLLTASGVGATLSLYADPNGTAISTGTLLHAWDLTLGAGPTSTAVTLAGTDVQRTLNAGDRLDVVISAVPSVTTLGTLSLLLKPL